MKKLFIGIDSRHLEIAEAKKKNNEVAGKENSGLADSGIRTSHTSEDIEQIRDWARARMSRTGHTPGATSTVVIFEAIEIVSHDKQSPTKITP